MARLHVDLDAVRFNLKRLRARSAVRVMLVCKSDFYGLGMALAARVESDVDLFAVGTVREARALHALTSARDILLLYPSAEKEGLAEHVDASLESPRILPTILPLPGHAEYLHARLAGRNGPPFPCYVLIPQPGDRFWSDHPLMDVLGELRKRPYLAIRGVFSHFADAGSLAHDELNRRASAFVRELNARCPGVPTSISDSHLTAESAGLDLGFVRVGLFPLGMVDPAGSEAWGLRHALTLTARVVNGYAVTRPLRVGYDPRVIEPPAAVSIVDIGFASGLPFDFFRHCPAAAPDGTQYRFLAKPWMEYSALLTGEAPLPIGTSVELFGPNLHAGIQAGRAGIPIEALFCHLGRVARTPARAP